MSSRPWSASICSTGAFEIQLVPPANCNHKVPMEQRQPESGFQNRLVLNSSNGHTPYRVSQVLTDDTHNYQAEDLVHEQANKFQTLSDRIDPQHEGN